MIVFLALEPAANPPPRPDVTAIIKELDKTSEQGTQVSLDPVTTKKESIPGKERFHVCMQRWESSKLHIEAQYATRIN